MSNGHVAEEGVGPPSAAGLDGAGFVLKWLLLGPYTGSSCGTLGARLRGDWLRETAGAKETDLLWTKNQVVNTNYALAESDGLHPNAGTALPTIREYSGGSDTVNLNDSVWPPDPDNVMAYAFVYIDNVTNAPRRRHGARRRRDLHRVTASTCTNDACRNRRASSGQGSGHAGVGKAWSS
jgi:hypothetical protein